MGYIGSGEAVPVIIDGLSKLEYRGTILRDRFL
jgi:glucosamine 6-phosphate synthetase-like amidotransferase/phosphosugar isomerase protein